MKPNKLNMKFGQILTAEKPLNIELGIGLYNNNRYSLFFGGQLIDEYDSLDEAKLMAATLGRAFISISQYAD